MVDKSSGRYQGMILDVCSSRITDCKDLGLFGNVEYFKLTPIG
jgi:hypothetical protein